VKDTITLKEALDWLDSGAPFDISFVTCDAKRNTGGELIHIKNARKHLFVGAAEKERLAKAQPEASVKRNPAHYENSTRNLRLENNQIRKVHIRLIRRLNNKTVL
jgi:hypothetical protein